jgi:hypothetical protein
MTASAPLPEEPKLSRKKTIFDQLCEWRDYGIALRARLQEEIAKREGAEKKAVYWGQSFEAAESRAAALQKRYEYLRRVYYWDACIGEACAEVHQDAAQKIDTDIDAALAKEKCAREDDPSVGIFANEELAALLDHVALEVECGERALRPEGVWVAVSERLPEAPHEMLLVTNNIDARDAHGFMSHLWLVRMIHHSDERGYYAFDDYDNIRPESITHWRYALAVRPGREG